MLHLVRQLTHNKCPVNVNNLELFPPLIFHISISLLSVPHNKIPGENSNKQKTLPDILTVFIGLELFKSHILIVLSYEPVATLPEFNSIISEIESLWALNDLAQVKFI